MRVQMKTNYQFSIIGKLRAIRQEHNLSQATVASLLGISTGQMGNIETPKAAHKYTLGQIYALCQYVHIPIVDIFLEEDEKQLPTAEQIDLFIQKLIEYEQ